MDSNGYNKSLFDTHKETCFYCHQRPPHGQGIRHEIFFGERNRSISKMVGAWVYLCPRCHGWVHAGVHVGRDKDGKPITLDTILKQKAEQAFRNTYTLDFNRVFYGALKNWEIDELKDEVKERERK